MEVMVKRLSERAEFWIILIVAFGYPVVAGVMNLVAGPRKGPVRIADADLWMTAGYEALVGLLIIGFLRLRGMAWEALRPEISWLQTLRGVAVFFFGVGATFLAFAIAAGLPSAEERLSDTPIETAYGWPAAVAVVFVAPLFEECLNLGYLQERLRVHGAAFAVGASLLLRLLTNLEQGPQVVIGIVPIGLVFGIYYWRTGRMWPILVAHAMMEAIGLYAMSHPPAAG